jgi:bacterioferritin
MAVAPKVHSDILNEENRARREDIIRLLTKAYWMEVETVINYLANSVNPDGVRAQEIIESLGQDVEEELGHALEAERAAIKFYNEIIEAANEVDWVTQDMVIGILRDEQAHLRLFEGFLREYAKEGLA